MASHHLRVSILKSSCPVCSYTACSKTFWETEEDKSICWQRSSFCRKKRNKSLHHINESWDFRATFCRWAAIYLVLFELSFQIKSSECFQRKPLLHQSSSTSFWFLINTTQTRSTKAAFLVEQIADDKYCLLYTLINARVPQLTAALMLINSNCNRLYCHSQELQSSLLH